MSKVATTKLSSRGQVVIPEEIRRRLDLEPGAQFVVVGDGDTVVLKLIQPFGLEAFDTLIARARTAAEAAGLKAQDIDEAIRRARTDR